jgi:hypothetical protein
VQFSQLGIPLTAECNNVWCNKPTIAIWSCAAVAVLSVAICLCYNCLAHWRANRATEVPRHLRRIREKQARMKQMQLKIAPARPEYLTEMKATKHRAKLDEDLRKGEELKAKQLRREIRDTEEKLVRKRVRLGATCRDRSCDTSRGKHHPGRRKLPRHEPRWQDEPRRQCMGTVTRRSQAPPTAARVHVPRRQRTQVRALRVRVRAVTT